MSPTKTTRRRVAAALAAAAPADALVARYGGEEFVLIADGSAAAGLARQLLAAVRDLQMAHAAAGSAGRVTISAGALVCRPQAQAGAAALLAAADELLYEAKHGGRDRCCCRHEHGATELIFDGGELR